MGVYDDKRTVFVDSINGVIAKHVWPTNIDAADGTALGHQPISALTGVGVAGASRPLPARLSRTRATGVTSSYVDWQSFNSAKAAGWKVTKGAKAPPAPGGSTKTLKVGAEIATNVIAVWAPRREQLSKIGADLTDLGIETLTAAQSKYGVQGGNKWYGVTPSGARKPGADETLSVAYVSAAAVDSLPTGWSSDSDDSIPDPTLPIN